MKDEKEIRLSIEEFEAVLKKAKLLSPKEAVYKAWIEPGEMIIKVLR